MKSKNGSKGDARNQNTVSEIKNAFDGLSSGLYMAKEEIIELEDMSTKISQTEKQRIKQNN